MLTRTCLAAAAAALLGATACGSSPSAPRVAGSVGHGAAPGSSPAALTPAQRTQAWLAFTACLRAHGAAVPDPSFDQEGNPQWSVNPKDQPVAAIQACESHLQGVSSAKTGPPPTAAELAQATHFAQCLRQHGLPTWPDPDPQTGGFDLRGADPKGMPGFQAAAQACRQLQPSKR